MYIQSESGRVCVTVLALLSLGECHVGPKFDRVEWLHKMFCILKV